MLECLCARRGQNELSSIRKRPCLQNLANFSKFILQTRAPINNKTNTTQHTKEYRTDRRDGGCRGNGARSASRSARKRTNRLSQVSVLVSSLVTLSFRSSASWRRQSTLRPLLFPHPANKLSIIMDVFVAFFTLCSFSVTTSSIGNIELFAAFAIYTEKSPPIMRFDDC